MEPSRRRPKFYYDDVTELLNKRPAAKEEEPKAFWSQRRLILTNGGSVDTPDLGIVEATVRFGPSYKDQYKSIILRTLASLIHEFKGQHTYEVSYLADFLIPRRSENILQLRCQ